LIVVEGMTDAQPALFPRAGVSSGRAPARPPAARLERSGRHPQILLPSGKAPPLPRRHAEMLAVLAI
jgi:hypothetical protein